METRDMPVSYQDFVLSNQYFGTPMPTDPKMKMELTPIVYENMRTIGARPSRLQQGLRTVGRGLAIAGGAGLAVGVANSLFNKPSDNYEQSVTNNQTSGGRDNRVNQLSIFDQNFETDNEKYAKTGGLGESTPPSKSTTPAQTVSITDKVEDFIGPRQVPTETKKDLKYLNNVRSRFGRMQAQGFSSGLRNEDQEANIAAARSGEYQISDKEAADIAAAENMPASPTVQADQTARKMRQRQHIENDMMLPWDSPLRRTFGGKTNPPEETTLMDMMSDDTPLTDKIVSFVNKTKKNLPEKKTPKVTDIREKRVEKIMDDSQSDILPSGEPPADMADDLRKFDNEKNTSDFYYKGTGESTGTPTGSKKADPLATLDQVVSEGGTSSNPVIGGLQAGVKTGRVLGSVVKRGAQDSAEALKLATQYIQNSEAMKKIQRATDTNPDISDYGLKRKLVEERIAKREAMKGLTGGFGEVNEKMYEDLKSKGLIDDSE